ncbi:MAG TPA: hypothetical protein VHO91_10830 [Rhodopila sp.]|nr:hypothetical protein [Rhodopila sp.]
MPNVAAAARAAGIKPQERVLLGHPATVADRIAAKGADYARQVIRALEAKLHSVVDHDWAS